MVWTFEGAVRHLANGRHVFPGRIPQVDSPIVITCPMCFRTVVRGLGRWWERGR